jgi:hypothetical protein
MKMTQYYLIKTPHKVGESYNIYLMQNSDIGIAITHPLESKEEIIKAIKDWHRWGDSLPNEYEFVGDYWDSLSEYQKRNYECWHLREFTSDNIWNKLNIH